MILSCNDDVRWTWFDPTWSWFERMLITVLNVGDTVFLVVTTVVSRVSAHGRSTITPRFSVYWALTRDTGRLPCVKIEIGGADSVGVAATKRVRVEHCMHAGSSSV